LRAVSSAPETVMTTCVVEVETFSALVSAWTLVHLTYCDYKEGTSSVGGRNEGNPPTTRPPPGHTSPSPFQTNHRYSSGLRQKYLEKVWCHKESDVTGTFILIIARRNPRSNVVTQYTVLLSLRDQAICSTLKLGGSESGGWVEAEEDDEMPSWVIDAVRPVCAQDYMPRYIDTG